MYMRTSNLNGYNKVITLLDRIMSGFHYLNTKQYYSYSLVQVIYYNKIV